MEKLNEATIVSVFPWEITEQKPGLNPGLYVIPAAAEGDFAILPIQTGEMSIYIGSEHKPYPSIQVPEFANVIAKAIVWDYCRAQLEFKLGEASPGLFWIPGFPKKDEIKVKYAAEIAKARKEQLKWFELLVRVADTSWNRTKSHREISDLQRLAITFLRNKAGEPLKREWAIEYVSI